jgi:hypothetical protein
VDDLNCPRRTRRRWRRHPGRVPEVGAAQCLAFQVLRLRMGESDRIPILVGRYSSWPIMRAGCPWPVAL